MNRAHKYQITFVYAENMGKDKTVPVREVRRASLPYDVHALISHLKNTIIYTAVYLQGLSGNLIS